MKTEKAAHNTGLAKVAVQCSADAFEVNQSLVLRINMCGEIATFAKPETVGGYANHQWFFGSGRTDRAEVSLMG